MNDELPAGWTWATPPGLASSDRRSLGIGPFGSDLRVSDYCDEGVPLVFVRHIRAERFEDRDSRFVSHEKAIQLRAHEVQPGDVLITKMGDPPGDSAVYPMSRPSGIITADCIRWRINPSAGGARFFAYATRAPAVSSQILSITQGVAQRKVSLARFNTVRYPVAPVPEQRRIVAALESYFTRLDNTVATLERVQRNLKRYRVSVLKAAVEGRLVPTDAELARAEGRSYEPASMLLTRILAERRRRWEEAELAKMTAKGMVPKDDKWKAKYVEPVAPNMGELPDLPEGWRWIRIDTAGHVQLGRQRSPAHHTGANMRPYLRVANVFEDRIDVSDVMSMHFTPKEFETYRLKFGDILLNEGQSPHLVGRPAMYRDEVPGACFTNSLVRFQAFKGVDPRFALLVFLAQLNMRRYMRIAQITTNIAHLGAGRFAEIEFPLPPLAEQSRIADEADRLMTTTQTATTTVASNLARVGRVRQSILKAAFEGRLVDQDRTDEPASVLLERIRAERVSATKKPPRRARLALATAPKS